MLAAGSESRTDFLVGSGEMGALIRAFDWSLTPLGPIDSWPQVLKTSISLILSSRHPMWIGWGPRMTFLYNDAYLHVLGPAKHPHALGRPASEVWSEIWDVCGPLADKVVKSGEASFVDDVRLFMDRGDFLEETFYSFSYSPIRDHTGNVCGLFCPSTDVTPKVLNARRLATLSELAANALVEKTIATACASAALTLEKNPDDIPFALLYLADETAGHASLEQAVGAFGTEVLQTNIVDLNRISASSPWHIAEVFRAAHRRVIPVEALEWLPLGVANKRVAEAVVLPVTSSGEHRPYGVLICGVNPCRRLDAEYTTFFELVAGQFAAAIQNASAAEEEKKRADALAELNRAKTVFFSNVSHEFRTPLTLMLGPLEALLAKAPDLNSDDREQLSIAHRNSLRLLKLVNSLLDFSRIEAGRIKAWYTPVDLSALTAELASNFRSALEAAGLKFIVECPPLRKPVYVDREMWEKIVLNLLSNAFKFTFKGSVTVRMEAADDAAVLHVSDTGIGISEADLPRLFERFHRIEGARGRTYEGTGIGLALVQELVKLHGGHISISSRVGEGSTFTVSIPFGKQHLPKEQVGRGEARPISLSRLESYTGEALTWLASNSNPAVATQLGATSKKRACVLIAEDNADMREYASRILAADSGYEILTAPDGEKALELIRRNPPDLLIADTMMPALDGLGLLKGVRADPATQSLPVILLSARAGEDERVEGLEAGADDYLVKPFAASELRARVGTHIRLAALRRQAAEREAALRADAEAQRDRAINILENMSDGFFALDRDWRITYANAEAERLTGMRREDIVGKRQWELFAYAVGTPAYQELQRAAAQRVAVNFETYYEPWKRWLHLKAQPASEGGMFFFFEDITERKRAQEAVRESEETFRAIVETTPECVKLVAADGTVLHMNSWGLKIVSAEHPEDVIGHSVYHLIAPEFKEAYRAFNEKICSGERGSLEFEIVDLKGVRKQMETHAAALRRPDGTAVQLAITRDVSERTVRERASLLLGSIVETSDDAIISKDLNGIVTSWNKSAERVFGYTSEEALGKPITILIPEDRQHEEPEILTRLRHGDRVDHFETIRRRKDGVLLNVSLTISPIKDSTGKIVGASKIARNITERKRNEAAIQQLNTQLTLELSAMMRMQQLSTRLVRTADFQELLGEIIDAALEITGAEMGNIQLLENDALSIVAQRGFDAPFLEFLNGAGQSACRGAMQAGERVIIEDVNTSPEFDDRAREIMLEAGARALQCTPLVSRSGQLFGTLSTYYRAAKRPGDRDLRFLDLLARQVADLIERDRAQAELHASEGRFRQLADSMPQIVWTARPDGYVDYYNQRWYEFTGFAKDQFGDASWQRALHPEDVQRSREYYYACIGSGRPYQIEYRFWDRHDRRWRWFMGRALPVRDEYGSIVKWFGSCTDIDDQKRVEEELRRANSDLEQFAFSASHDLQEPLRSVKIYSELLSNRYRDQLDGPALQFCDYMREGATRMEQLVRDLLAYTRVSKLEAPTGETDANAALGETLANLNLAIQESGAQITSDSLPPVRVHSAHMQQLFQNLIGNAIKYRGPDRVPVIHVSAQKQSEQWVFSIQDNGIGIDPQYKERIFGLFKRLHTGDQYSGTGIGLAICQRIVERYHGRIWVESNPGHGSTFRFSLPV
ncbi:MAG: PAS domain S-box protein [Bryobacterales bacterium]|nr:PAS domain S-box protein [Bryobacterales bacterium]